MGGVYTNILEYQLVQHVLTVGGGDMGSNYRVIAVSTHTVLYQVHDPPL